MKLVKYSTGQPEVDQKEGITKSVVQTGDGYIEISHHSSADDLDNIRIGTRIRSVDGKKGVVADIEVLRRHGEVQYYFRLEKGMGTILVIK